MRLKQYLTESKLKWKKQDEMSISGKWTIQDFGSWTTGEVIKLGRKKGTQRSSKYTALIYDGKFITKRPNPSIKELKDIAQRLQDVMTQQNIKDPKDAIEWIKANK